MFALPVDFAVGLALVTLTASFVLSLASLFLETRPASRKNEVRHDC